MGSNNLILLNILVLILFASNIYGLMPDGSGVSRSIPNQVFSCYENSTIYVNSSIFSNLTYYIIEEYIPSKITVFSTTGVTDNSNVLKWTNYSLIQPFNNSYSYNIKMPCDGRPYNLYGTYLIENMSSNQTTHNDSTIISYFINPSYTLNLNYKYNELNDVSNFMVSNSYGQIKFNENVNLTNNLYFSGNLKIHPTDTFITSNLNFLNKSATITLNNVSKNNPIILRDGLPCYECNLTYNGNRTSPDNLTFNVSYVSFISIDEGPFCGDNVCSLNESCISDCGVLGNISIEDVEIKQVNTSNVSVKINLSIPGNVKINIGFNESLLVKSLNFSELNETQNITIPNLHMGTKYFFTITACNATNCNTSSVYNFTTLKFNFQLNWSEWDRNTTNLSRYGFYNLQRLSNLTFSNSHGKINFLSNLNLSRELNLINHVIVSNNRIFIDSSSIPELNFPARLSLSNITASSPRIYKDGIACISDCEIVSYANNTIIFNVTSFSEYTVGETCGDGICNNGETSATCSADCPVLSGSSSGGSSSGGGGGGLIPRPSNETLESSEIINDSIETPVVNDKKIVEETPDEETIIEESDINSNPELQINNQESESTKFVPTGIFYFILFVSFVLIFAVINRNKLLPKKSDDGTMKKLTHYIEISRKKGFSKEKIMKNLKSKGWDEKTIEKLLK